MLFKDRQDAGRQLAQLLSNYKDKDMIVYALPRGGVVVAAEIAEALHAPLDLVLAHKIGHPYHQEYAVAAVSESGQLVESSRELLDKRWLEQAKQREMTEIERKRKTYMGGKPSLSAQGKIALIVDDGIATGLTMFAAIKELRSQHPKEIVVVVPVAPKDTADLIQKQVDKVVGIAIDEDFLGAVGAYYRDFTQVEDEEVVALLKAYKEKE